MRDIELRVAAHNTLTPEQARELYAAYVKRGLELDKYKAVAVFQQMTKLEDQEHAALIACLQRLRNEAHGLMDAHGLAIAADHGTSNMVALRLAVTAADAILESSTGDNTVVK